MRPCEEAGTGACGRCMPWWQRTETIGVARWCAGKRNDPPPHTNTFTATQPYTCVTYLEISSNVHRVTLEPQRTTYGNPCSGGGRHGYGASVCGPALKSGDDLYVGGHGIRHADRDLVVGFPAIPLRVRLPLGHRVPSFRLGRVPARLVGGGERATNASNS
jgi:hypothetical protein